MTRKGDGVITIKSHRKVKPVETVDLSPNVMNLMLTETASNMQHSNRRFNGLMDTVLSAIGGSIQTNFAEVQTLEGRAVSGVNATPLGGPTNAQK